MQAHCFSNKGLVAPGHPVISWVQLRVLLEENSCFFYKAGPVLLIGNPWVSTGKGWVMKGLLTRGPLVQPPCPLPLSPPRPAVEASLARAGSPLLMSELEAHSYDQENSSPCRG